MVTKLTSAKVRSFENRIRKTHVGVVFELTVTHGLLLRNIIELSRIIVSERKQGVGTAIMQELCEFADRHGAEIRLTPASKGDYEATTSRARLIRFYKRFGFAQAKVRPAEITSVPVMVRRPRFTSAPTPQTLATA